MTILVLITPEADAQIREIDHWWRENRPAAADLFLSELSRCFEVIASVPEIGRLYRASPVPRVRRLLLKETRYHLYYVLGAASVTVLAVWHARRGLGPPLRRD